MCLRYIIPGNPVPRPRNRRPSSREWNARKQIKLKYILELSRQHNDQPLLTGPIAIDINFYLPIKQLPQHKKLVGSPHARTPTLAALIVYVEKAATGVIFKKECTIASIHSKKLYDENPRTELTIRKL